MRKAYTRTMQYTNTRWHRLLAAKLEKVMLREGRSGGGRYLDSGTPCCDLTRPLMPAVSLITIISSMFGRCKSEFGLDLASCEAA
jgi:hypothetical protein